MPLKGISFLNVASICALTQINHCSLDAAACSWPDRRGSAERRSCAQPGYGRAADAIEVGQLAGLFATGQLVAAIDSIAGNDPLLVAPDFGMRRS